MKRSRGRPKLDKPVPSKRPFQLAPHELEALLKTKAYPLTFISTLSGSMQQKLNDFYFEFNSNKGGNIYYRCVSHATTKCGATLLGHNRKLYVISGEHNHPQPKPAKMESIKYTNEEVSHSNKVTVDLIDSGREPTKPKPTANKIELKLQIAQRLQNLTGFIDGNKK